MAELRLTLDEVEVQAGAYAEIELTVDDPAPADPEEIYAIGVTGLDAGWYTLSSRTTPIAAKTLLVLHPPRRPSLTSTGDYTFTVRAVPSTGAEQLDRRVSLTVVPPGHDEPSRLLQYLPGIYAEDDFTNRFLQIFQSLLDPIQSAVDSTSLCLDPDVAPPDMLEWLARWVGLRLDPCPDEASRRFLIREAVELAKWRGTRRGLERELRLRLGGRSLIVENFDGLRLGPDAALGLNSHLGEKLDGGVSVTLVQPAESRLDPDLLSGLVDELKPAYVEHRTRLAGWPVPQEVPVG